MRWILFLCFISLFSEPIPDKVLICGVCKNIEAAVPNTIFSAENLGNRFEDYRIIIYENNSTDQTKGLLSEWASKNKKVIFLSENLRKKDFQRDSQMNKKNRTEMLARARNIVLDKALKEEFDGYKYVVMADLDFLEPWDVDSLVETILHPEEEWDAVFAYGAYDLFAMRSEEWPIGFELLGGSYWGWLDRIWNEFKFKKDSPWKKVYSAFGGLAVYKRDALQGCCYSGVITPDLEKLMIGWLKKAREKKDICLLDEYENLLANSKIIELKEKTLKNRKKYPKQLGIKLANQFGLGEIVWFSCVDKATLPWTCEHIPLHASMILRGKDRLFINPKIRSTHPPE